MLDVLGGNVIEIALTDESNGPGTGGQRCGLSVWIRTPGGQWVATGERSVERVRRALTAIGCATGGGVPTRRPAATAAE